MRKGEEAGITLVEVLVAMLILGVGVMGYAAVQLNAVKLTEDTYSRSQAMAVAQDAIERLRANVDEIAQYTDANAWDNVPGWTACLDRVTACGEANMVQSDITQLNHMATNMLPNGSMKVAQCTYSGLDASGNPASLLSSAVCVTVAWGPTDVDNCDQQSMVDGDRGDDASCVIVEFIP